jgi:hypothetical protein
MLLPSAAGSCSALLPTRRVSQLQTCSAIRNEDSGRMFRLLPAKADYKPGVKPELPTASWSGWFLGHFDHASQTDVERQQTVQ